MKNPFLPLTLQQPKPSQEKTQRELRHAQIRNQAKQPAPTACVGCGGMLFTLEDGSKYCLNCGPETQENITEE